MKILKNASSFFINNLELLFYKWGNLVALNPYPVIISCIITTGLCSLGFLKMGTETKANLLWLPPDSEYNANQNWVDANFKKTTREEFVLFESGNVLTPESIRQMQRVHKAVDNIEKDGKKFQDICARVPVATGIINQRRRKKRQTMIVTAGQSDDNHEYLEDEFEAIKKRIYVEKNSGQVNLLDDKNKTKYCDLVTSLEEKCVQSSLLEMWSYREELINAADQEKILSSVNLLDRSPWYGSDFDFASLLGGITRNSSGYIVGARTAQMVWVVKVPEEGRVSSAISGIEIESADPTTLAWESALIDIVKTLSTGQMRVLVNAARSSGDISSETLIFDSYLLVGGYTIMFIYTILMLGRMNTLEVRLMLAVVGIVSIVMGFVIALGISFLLGYPFTPVHVLLPFLCLGIGIDDMFVIAQCWSNMKKNPLNAGLSHPEQMGTTLKHAGVAVTITTLTDVFVFGVGAVTQMPGLASFCVCTAIGLGSIYLLQITWFVAWMSLDERRIAAGRDGLVPCIVHEDFKPNKCSRINYGDIIVKKYARLLSSVVFRCLVVFLTLGFLAFGIWGSVLIRQKFDLLKLLPSDSYLTKWLNLHDKFYHKSGSTINKGEIYSSEFDYSDLHKFDKLSRGLQELLDSGSVLGDFDSWWLKLKGYATTKRNVTNWEDFANPTDFKMMLSDFLFSRHGFKYRISFKFAGSLRCNQPVPRIKASKITIEYLDLDGLEEHIPAKKKITDLIRSSNIPEGFSHVRVYVAWETDKIIGFELLRNIALSLTCIFLITLILLTNFPVCLLVFGNVLITLADIVGFLHFWKITIDVVSCINIVLSIGLCVDYSVHIGHAYLIAKGSRMERVVQAVSNIGPAVFNGGMTTFLALVLLGSSTSHVFETFFKVFALTVLFGLYHGLVLFPVLLSVAGPADKPAEPVQHVCQDEESTS